MANTSFFPPILNDNIQIPQKIIHADQTATITSINDFTSLLDGPGRYIVETNSTSRTTLLSIGLIPANVSGILEVIRVDEAEYDYYLNYRGENNKRWFATMIMGICSVWQEAAIKSDLDALNSQITNLIKRKYISVNVTTNQYDGYYYADVSDIGITGTVIGVFVDGVSNNLSAFVGYVNGQNKMRVFTKQPNITVNVYITYI